jgi:hypothetical protein
MALPPEPVEEVLPRAVLVVVGVVDAAEWLAPFVQRGDPDDDDNDSQVPAQKARMRVLDVLRGDVTEGASLTLEKPAGDYALRQGTKGAFLLCAGAAPGSWRILGRYGPDSWSVARVKEAVRNP